MVNVNKTTGERECIICHYWYFLEINFRFDPNVWNGCFNENHNHCYYKVRLKIFQKTNIKKLYYDTTDVFEGIIITKTSASKECIICHYCSF